MRLIFIQDIGIVKKWYFAAVEFMLCALVFQRNVMGTRNSFIGDGTFKPYSAVDCECELIFKCKI